MVTDRRPNAAGAVGPPDAARLSDIALRVSQCPLCPLHSTRTKAVPGEGSARSGIMLVGEAPGRNEDIQGRPFCGAAGRNLDLALAQAGIDRAACFVTSIVKCRPPGNRDPTPFEKEACRPYLMEQVAAVRPKVLVALGRHGLSGLIGYVPRDFADLPGTFLEGPGGVPVWVSLHPAAVIYRQKWKERYLADWNSFGHWLRSGEPAPLRPTPPPPPVGRANPGVRGKPRRQTSAPATPTPVSGASPLETMGRRRPSS